MHIGKGVAKTKAAPHGIKRSCRNLSSTSWKWSKQNFKDMENKISFIRKWKRSAAQCQKKYFKEDKKAAQDFNPKLKGDNIFATKILRKALRLGGIIMSTLGSSSGGSIQLTKRLDACKMKKDLALGHS